MAEVSIRNVSKSYGDNEVLHGVSAEVKDGEFIVIVGPSGCGKSTLLRMVAGLEEITSGEISIGGRVVNDIEPKDRDIAMVFQNYALYPHMTVRGNLAYGLKNRRMSRDEIDRRVREAAELLQIEPFLDRKPAQLSGGQRQRVAMGRAIVRDPSVFLFDEPLSNLDAKLRNQMRLEIRKLQRRLGTAMIYVTHDQVEAMTLADRIVVLNEGRVEQIGTPGEVYDHPASTFVATFIGAPPMNLVAGRAGDGSLTLAGEKLAVAPPSDGPVTVGLRPERATLATEAPDGAPALPAEVDVIEELGAHRLVHLVLGRERIAFTAAQDSLQRPPEGRIWLSFDAQDLHFFDPGTGRRL